MVILIYFAVYIALGLLVDTAYYGNLYKFAPLSKIFVALLTLKLIPYATLIMLLVSAVSLWVTYIFMTD